MAQKIITADNDYEALDSWIKEAGEPLLLVCDSSFGFLTGIKNHIEALENSGRQIVRFSDFVPNPLYESVVEGVRLFREKDCKSIFAVGGGSAMDVAKCIKLYSNMDPGRNYLEQEIVPNDVPFAAMPTTAGTGSEATRFAVIYYEGKKQSVNHISCIPETVLADSSALRTLPLYQKKSTMLDALCHATESFWSVNSTDESQDYSRQAIKLIMENAGGYLSNDDTANGNMLRAANLAGKAINITQTTAGHAMCYKITGIFGTAHGHSAAMCDRVLFPWMLDNTDRCIDSRGEAYLKNVFGEIAGALGCDNPEQAAGRFCEFFDSLGLEIPQADEEQFCILKKSVNADRLKNFPVSLDEDTIDALYHRILTPKE